MIEINESNLEDALKEKFLFLDFWAHWCNPCKQMIPIIETLAKEYEGKIAFAKCNTDENAKIASEFTVISLPSFVLFKSRKAITKLTGSKTKNALKEIINEFFS